MKKQTGLYCALLILIGGCNSAEEKAKVKEPEAAVVQSVSNDTLTTYYEGVRPCRGCKQINTEIKFVRVLPDTVGRFYLDEGYVNKRDSVLQQYLGTGNYKILPASNGDVNGVALYNLILDNQTDGTIYLLQDSLTLVKADAKGKPVTGDSSVTLKRRRM
jgi:hypothetical protein